MTQGPRVLFVGHDASRTGAPTVLASFLRWLPGTVRDQASLVLLRGGPLVAEYERHLPTRVVDQGARRIGRRVITGLGAVWPGLPPGLGVVIAGPPLRRAQVDVIVVNTLAALEPTVATAPSGVPIVCHVHELDGVAARVLPAPGATRDRLLAGVARFVAAGPAVRSMLVDRWHIDPGRVTVVDEFIDEPPVANLGDRVRRDLAIDADEVIVLAVGMAGPRKGTDYFIDLAAAMSQQPHRLRFVWAGGDPTSAAWTEARHDIDQAGLDGRVQLLPTVDDPSHLLSAADVVVSTAREDPFPLAALEAGAAGVPIAAFDSGGIGDMARAGGFGDVVVAVGDVLGLSDQVAGLAADRTGRRESGRRWATWVRSTHLAEHLAPALWQAIVEAS